MSTQLTKQTGPAQPSPEVLSSDQQELPGLTSDLNSASLFEVQRLADTPKPTRTPNPKAMLNLQRMIGNKAVQRLLAHGANRKDKASQGTSVSKFESARMPTIQRRTPGQPEDTGEGHLTTAEVETNRQRNASNAGLEIEVISGPRDYEEYIDRRLAAISWGPLATDGYLLHIRDLDMPVQLPEAYVNPSTTTAIPLNGTVYPNHAAAEAALRTAPRDGITYFAYYRGAGGNLIVPTLFCPPSAPRTIQAIVSAHEEYVNAVIEDMSRIGLSLIEGRVINFITHGILRLSANGLPQRYPPTNAGANTQTGQTATAQSASTNGSSASSTTSSPRLRTIQGGGQTINTPGPTRGQIGAVNPDGSVRPPRGRQLTNTEPPTTPSNALPVPHEEQAVASGHDVIGSHHSRASNATDVDRPSASRGNPYRRGGTGAQPPTRQARSDDLEADSPTPSGVAAPTSPTWEPLTRVKRDARGNVVEDAEGNVIRESTVRADGMNGRLSLPDREVPTFDSRERALDHCRQNLGQTGLRADWNGETRMRDPSSPYTEGHINVYPQGTQAVSANRVATIFRNVVPNPSGQGDQTVWSWAPRGGR